jgi:hypothetical protein
MLPSRPGDPVRRIRAHKVILAAASCHFKKTLLENAYIVSNDALSYGSSVFTNQTQEEKKPALVIPREDVKMMTPAIQFIYGFGLPGAYKTLHDVAEIVAIAEKYEIADLLTRATEIANNLLGGCQGGHQPNKRQTCPSGWLVAKMRPFRLVGWFNKVGLVGCLDGLPRIPLLM